MALSSLTHLQASSGKWVVSVSGRGGHVRIRRYVLERLCCSTPFHFCTESLPPSRWVPNPIYALRSFRFSWSLVAFVVPVSLLPPPPPSPFPRTTVLVPIPSRPTGEYFCGRPARPLPVGSPWPQTRRPHNRCQVPVPCPPSPFLCHSRSPFAPSPKLAYSSDHSGPWVTPRHGRGPRDQGCREC